MDEKIRQRREWFDNDRSRFELPDGQAKDFKYKYTCPCCGYPTVTTKHLYDICSLCKWEDDGVDEPNLDSASGPNHITLRNARRNFSAYLVMYDPQESSRIMGGNRNSGVELDVKKNMMAAFDAMIGVTDLAILEPLWTRVRQCDETLYAELRQRIEDYEANFKVKR